MLVQKREYTRAILKILIKHGFARQACPGVVEDILKLIEYSHLPDRKLDTE